MLESIPIIPSVLGKLVTAKPANPAGGANFNFATPVNTIILPISLQFQLVTDATVANRTPLILVNDGTDNIFITPSPYVQTASLTKIFIAQSGGFLGATAATYLYQTMNLSNLLYMRFGDTFGTIIDGLQAGDAITNIKIRYMQWIQE